MNFKQAVSTCFSKYVGFDGRAARSEYWYWVLFAILASLILGIVDAMLFGATPLKPLGTIFSLAVLLPSLAAAARRFHDMDRSGWWQLLHLIPGIGTVIVLIWLALRGTEGPNRFGPDPLGASAPSAA